MMRRLVALALVLAAAATVFPSCRASDQSCGSPVCSCGKDGMSGHQCADCCSLRGPTACKTAGCDCPADFGKAAAAAGTK